MSFQTLSNLFFRKNLVELSKIEPRSPPPIRRQVNVITPMTKMILSTVSPASKESMLCKIREDDLMIASSEEVDPDYQEKMENCGLGFYMESFISWYGICPVCREPTLRKYLQSNVPVVDFVCINREYHMRTQTCFLFQLKISLFNEYFSLYRQTISIGSRKYGELPHSIKGTDKIEMKRVVPGYICVRLNQKGLQNYQISEKESFVLIPNYQSSSNLSYYQYLTSKDRYGKDVITWNPSMFFISGVNEMLITQSIGYEFFGETPLPNPYAEL